MRILKENTIGIVIDIQELLFPYMDEYQKLEKNLQTLIQGLNVLEVPMIVTQQYTKGLKPTIESVAKAVGEFEHIEKMSFSCCDEPKFDEALALTGMKNVLLFGIETHVCVLQTCIDLLNRGYRPIVVEDCVSSRNSNDKNMAIERMRQAGATITTKESILFELLRYSGSEQFKAISKLVK